MKKVTNTLGPASIAGGKWAGSPAPRRRSTHTNCGTDCGSSVVESVTGTIGVDRVDQISPTPFFSFRDPLDGIFAVPSPAFDRPLAEGISVTVVQ